MAKISPKTGSSHIRFIMLEADIPEGDLSQITQAIQNALKPASPPVSRILLQSPKEAGNARNYDAESELIQDLEPAVEDELQTESRVSARPAQRTRSYRSPQIVEVDLDTEPSFVAFATAKSPTTTLDKYLTIATWFKEARNTPSVTADDIYTCFRKMGWSTAIDDFSQPLRKLKSQKLMGGDASGFVINHIGLDKVRKLGQG